MREAGDIGFSRNLLCTKSQSGHIIRSNFDVDFVPQLIASRVSLVSHG
jgi:hypothetical protein